MYKNRKKYVWRNIVILGTAIIILNFIGISYANWNDNTQVSNNIIMGKIDPKFLGGDSFLIDQDRKNISFDSSRTKADLGELSLYEGEEINLSLHINNEGTVPVKSEGITANQNGITIQVPHHEIEPGGTVDVPISITASAAGEGDFYNSNIKMLYKQNNPEGSWEKELTINGSIIVEEPEIEEVELEELAIEEMGLEKPKVEKIGQEEPQIEKTKPEEVEGNSVNIEPSTELNNQIDSNLQVNTSTGVEINADTSVEQELKGETE